MRRGATGAGSILVTLSLSRDSLVKCGKVESREEREKNRINTMFQALDSLESRKTKRERERETKREGSERKKFAEKE